MASRIDQERLKAVLDRSNLNDRELGAFLGVHQTTVWRLRAGKIYKISKYIEKLQSRFGSGEIINGHYSPEYLVELSKHSPGLQEVLTALSKFMQENAKPSGS